jgi:flagellar hook-associated protein 2
METTSTTGSATRSLVTALGAGSGIDMVALAENLAVAQFAGRTDRLAARSETLDRQISAASSIKNMLFSLATSLGERVRIGDLSPQPQVANGSVAQASLTGTRQPSGSYSLEVTALARSQTLASPVIAAPAGPVGAGSLTFRFGTISGAAFAEDTGHATVTVNIASGATLADVAGAINASGAGISAYVANTTEGAKLVLKGAEGAANGFIVEAAETPGEEGLAQFAWTPAAAPERLLAGAANAAFRVDGLDMTSPTNTVSEAIPGVKLKLAAINTGNPTTVTFSDPSEAISQAMQDLTSALNEVAAELRTHTDPVSGDLARDSGARALRRAMAELAGGIVMPNAAAGEPRTLADLGLSTQRDGSFALDPRRLSATLAADPKGAAAMFTTGLFGVYASIDKLSRTVSRSSDPGTLAGSISRYTAQRAQVSDDQAKLADQQEALRARMVARFAVSENRIGASRATLSFIQNQIAAWNAQND